MSDIRDHFCEKINMLFLSVKGVNFKKMKPVFFRGPYSLLPA